MLARLGRADAAVADAGDEDEHGDDAGADDERPARPRRVQVGAGTEIEGTVLRLSVAGADVETPAGILLVPMREFGRGFVREPSDALAIGQTVRGVVQTGADGSPILSLAGGAHDLLAEIAARGPGAILLGRVHESRPGLVKIDVAAGVTGVIRLGRDARGPRAGSRLPVEVVAVSAEEGRLELRLAGADAEPGEPLRLYDGGPAFLEGAAVEGDAERIARLEDELDRVEAERDELLGEVNRLRARLGEDRGDRGPGRSFAPRESGDRPYRPRDGGGDRPYRPRDGGGGERPSRPREGGGDRPYRPRDGGGDRPYRPRDGGGGDRPFRPRDGGGERPFRPREGGDRPYRPQGEGGGDRPYRRDGGGGERPHRPREGGDRPYRPQGEGGGDRPYRPRDGGGGERPYRPREEVAIDRTGRRARVAATGRTARATAVAASAPSAPARVAAATGGPAVVAAATGARPASGPRGRRAIARRARRATGPSGRAATTSSSGLSS